jgi:multicomponent Na+:H+ antiporter subunit E
MKLFLTNILLAFVWLLLTAELTTKNFLFGFVICYLILWIAFRKVADHSYFTRAAGLISLAGYFIKDIVFSGFDVAYDVIRTGKSIHPGIIRIKTEASSDLEIVFLSNLITLTPGSLVLDYEEDKRLIYVHLLNIKKEKNTRNTIQTLEKKIKKVFG